MLGERAYGDGKNYIWLTRTFYTWQCEKRYPQCLYQTLATHQPYSRRNRTVVGSACVEEMRQHHGDLVNEVTRDAHELQLIPIYSTYDTSIKNMRRFIASDSMRSRALFDEKTRFDLLPTVRKLVRAIIHQGKFQLRTYRLLSLHCMIFGHPV